VRIHTNQLRHVGNLQSFEATGTDSRGQPTGTWEGVSTVRVKIEPLSGRTAEYAHQLYDLTTHVLWMRYRSGVTAAQRLVVGTRTFHFGYVENVDEADRYLRILATEVPA
jgi:SPP1 family predicted phage head-tail adaptor